MERKKNDYLANTIYTTYIVAYSWTRFPTGRTRNSTAHTDFFLSPPLPTPLLFVYTTSDRILVSMCVYLRIIYVIEFFFFYKKKPQSFGGRGEKEREKTCRQTENHDDECARVLHIVQIYNESPPVARYSKIMLHRLLFECSKSVKKKNTIPSVRRRIVFGFFFPPPLAFSFWPTDQRDYAPYSPQSLI